MLCLITSFIPEEFLLKIQLLSDVIIASTAIFITELLCDLIDLNGPNPALSLQDPILSQWCFSTTVE